MDLMTLMQMYALNEENARRMMAKESHVDERGAQWERAEKFYRPQDARHNFFANREDMWKHCGLNGMACAEAIDGNEFAMPWGMRILPYDAPQWLRDHEDKHLDGWLHPRQTINWGRYGR